MHLELGNIKRKIITFVIGSLSLYFIMMQFNRTPLPDNSIINEGYICKAQRLWYCEKADNCILLV